MTMPNLVIGLFYTEYSSLLHQLLTSLKMCVYSYSLLSYRDNFLWIMNIPREVYPINFEYHLIVQKSHNCFVQIQEEKEERCLKCARIMK